MISNQYYNIAYNRLKLTDLNATKELEKPLNI